MLLIDTVSEDDIVIDIVEEKVDDVTVAEMVWVTEIDIKDDILEIVCEEEAVFEIVCEGEIE